MKKTLVSLLMIVLTISGLHAQDLQVHKTDGTVITVPLNAIDSITFANGSTGGQGQPCPGTPTVTDTDGNVYNTVLIGNQCWMNENLNTTKDAAGSPITRYCYSDNLNNCDLYGGLYNWPTLMNGASGSNSNPSGVQGICPTGWHVPSDAEWTQLVDYFVAQGFLNDIHDPNGAGNALKSCRQVNSPLGGDCNTTMHPRWDSHNIHHGFDVFGFSGLPGGINPNGFYAYLGYSGYWWSSTETGGIYYRSLSLERGSLHRGDYTPSYRLSVRCLKD